MHCRNMHLTIHIQSNCTIYVLYIYHHIYIYMVFNAEQSTVCSSTQSGCHCTASFVCRLHLGPELRSTQFRRLPSALDVSSKIAFTSLATVCLACAAFTTKAIPQCLSAKRASGCNQTILPGKQFVKGFKASISNSPRSSMAHRNHA